ncbi:MAG: sugar phosphate isomerase/epimerase [Chloroflexi bacterium]|nr:sugar phosphate isomerase/epimerase [Chloroflexota bacterium]
MKLGFNGATTMTSPFETDVRIAGQAGYDVLEITAIKLDKYLLTHTLADARKLIDAAKLKTHAINSIEQINTRDATLRNKMLARTQQISERCNALNCPWIIADINDVEKMPREFIEDANRVFPGDGVIPLKEIIRAVRGIGYRGVASVEIFRPAYWRRQPLAVAKEAFLKSKKYI